MNWEEGVQKIMNSKSRIFLIGCGLFILGIFLSLMIPIERRFLLRFGYAIVLFLLFLFSWLGKNLRIRLFVLGGLIFVIGFLRGVCSVPVWDANHVTVLAGGKTQFTGNVINARINVDGVAYTIMPDDYQGGVLVQSALYPRYSLGDHLQILCKLDIPDDPGYARYLRTQNIFVSCSFAKIEYLGAGKVAWGKQKLDQWRQALSAKINSLWPEPRSSLLAGILYGDRGSMPKNLKDSFSNSGLSHIVAVSGYNTSVVAAVVLAVFIFVGCWRRKAFWLSSFSLVLFTFFTGATASVVRAAVMAIFVMLGGYWGRPARMLNSLLLAASLMLFWNPVILFDLGFQLSFLATVGVAFVGPLLQKKSSFRLPSIIEELCFTTLGALIATLPLTIFYFGRIPALALVANILVVGLIPVIMLFGFLALFFSFFIFPISLLLAFITDWGLRYIIFISDLCAGGSVTFSFSFVIMLVVYALIGFWLYRLSLWQKKRKLK